MILNADDFGCSAGVNDAVCALHDEGLVTSASLMVAAPAAWDAAARLGGRPTLAVGLHVALVGAPALLPPAERRLLSGPDGKLPAHHLRAGLAATLNPAFRRELRAEMRAQFKAFAELGVPWSHVDTHLHFGLTPVVFEELLRCCREHPVVGIRIPEDDWRAYRRLDPRGAARPGMALALRLGCAYQRLRLRATPYQITRRCYGFFRSGRLDRDYLARLIEELPDGDSELHCHPDLSTAAGRAEFEALRSAEVRRALHTRGVRLATYASLGSRHSNL